MNLKHLISASFAILVSFALSATAQTAGTVFGWGQNVFGQASPGGGGLLVGIMAIAAGSDDAASPNSVGFSLGLQPNGAIKSWGNTAYQQTSYPTTNSIYFTAVAAGEYHGLGLSIDGKVYAWGTNSPSYRQTNVPSILASNVIAIAAGGSGTDVNNGNNGTHSLALKNDGTVVAWGRNSSGQTNVPVNLSNVVAIAAGSAHSMALKADGTVAVWGLGFNGQTNVPAIATNVVAIAAGSSHCLALRTNGMVVAWGNNSSQQASVPNTLSNVVAIAAGDQHSLALRRDGTMVVWGTTNNYSFVLPAGLSNVIAIASSGRHALAISNSAPGITVPPRDQSVYPGSKAVFVVMAAGQGALTYQWQKNGINISGATGPILVLTNVQPANSGSYQVTVRNVYGIAAASAGLTVLDGRVSITQQPANTNSVDANSNLTVSVTAAGAIPLYYEWWKDGAIIAGATNASYTITNAQMTDAGAYSVIVSNGYDSVVSGTENVGVIYHAPFFVVQPISSTNVPVGGAFNLSAAVTGTSPFGWQWRTNGTPIPGAIATNYGVNAAQLSDAWIYDVVVTNYLGTGAGSTTSSTATVNVGYTPVVVSPPASMSNNIGDTVSFSCVVTGTPTISLQWTLNGYPIAGQTNSNLTLTNVRSTNIGFYAVVATNNFGSAASSSAALNLNSFNFSQWAGLVAYYALNGDATDSSGNGNDGTNFGAVAALDRFGNTNSAMSFDGVGSYIQCKTGGYFGSNFTISAWVNATAYKRYSRILDFGNGPATDNSDLPLTSGTSGMPYFEAYVGSAQIATCSSPSVIPQNSWVHVVGTCSPTQISLYFNGVQMVLRSGFNLNRTNITTTRNYIGKSNWSVSGFNDLLFMGFLDDIRLYNRALSSNEVAQLFALEGDVPVITQQPQAQTVDAGNKVSFSVAATANHPLTYQWRTNDVPIPGATNSVLTLSNVQSANIGFYSVAVSNSVTGVVSFGALLNLTGAADPTTTGLIAYYPLNGNANDAGTNGLNGITNNSGTFWTTNRFGVANGALGLDGSTGFMSVKDPGALLNFDIRSNNYTITTWVYLNNSLALNDHCILIDRGTKLNPPTSYTLVYSGTDNIFFVQMWDGGDFVQVNSSSAVSFGRWYQLAVVVANRAVSLFVNGVNESVPKINGGIAPGGFGNTKNTDGIRDFGRFAYTDFVNYLNGNISDIRFYNRALSADEVAHLHALESQSSVQPTLTLTANLGVGPNLNLYLTGLPGSSYVLQTTTNLTPLIQWLSVLTNTAGTDGVCQFTDTNLDRAQRFYRITTP